MSEGVSEGSRNAATAGYSGIIGTLDINVTTQSQREESEHSNSRSGCIKARDTADHVDKYRQKERDRRRSKIRRISSSG